MKRSRQYISAPAVVSSFLGMILAVPLAFALSSPANDASAAQSGQTATAEVTTADFAKYAYAFNQGYEARLASASASSTDMDTTCSEASVTSGRSGSGVSAPSSKVTKSGSDASHQNKLASMINSYNTYTSMVYNSSSVTNTNSNNAVGSNNSTMTSVKVEDSKGVLIGVSNDPYASQVATNDSFNKDSYNTSTQTSIVNDSYNSETNTAVNSGNTSTSTKNVTENSNNTTSNEVNTTTNTTQNKTIGSYNETTVDTDVDITSQQGPKPPHHNV